MRILYVTPLWAGLEDVIYEGKEEPRGMPAFFYPLKKLISLGHHVDLIIASPYAGRPLNVGAAWLRETKVCVVQWALRGGQQVLSPLRLFIETMGAICKRHYDFVYCHGSVGAVGNLAATIRSVPCGMRLYGTFLPAELPASGPLGVWTKHPLECAAFRLRKSFLIMTNDGTGGDRAYRRLAPAKAKYEFHFLLNGVDKAAMDGLLGEANNPEEEIPRGRHLFYPARMAPWKRQHLALDVLWHLDQRGYHDIALLFAGHISDQSYWVEVQGAASKRNVGQRVRHLGTLARNELFSHYRGALAVLSLYDFANLGNVTIEALYAGAVVVAWDDGSLDGVIENGVNGILVNTPEQAAEQIALLLQDPQRAEAIRRCAKERATRLFPSWEERSLVEVQLIYRATNSAQA